MILSLPSVIKCLIVLGNDDAPEVSADANSLLAAVSKFYFIVSLLILEVISVHTHALSCYLQGVSIDITLVKETTKCVIGTLKKIRNEETFSLLWEKANSIGSTIKEVLDDSDSIQEFHEATLSRQRRAPRATMMEQKVYNSIHPKIITEQLCFTMGLTP